MTTRSDFLITPADLNSILDDSNLRIFDCSVYFRPSENGYRTENGLTSYREAHVPGAAYLDLLDDFADTTSDLHFTLPSVDELSAAIGAAGISSDADVVVYSAEHMMWATRAWWLLTYAGHQRVRILDGGLAAWRAAGLPVESGDKRYAPIKFESSPRPERFAGIEEVEAAAAGKACVINTLPAEMYEGTGDLDYGRRGHIPGSHHLFYDSVLTDGAFLDEAPLRNVLHEAGMLDAGRVITYCGGGIAATVQAFACLLVGKEDVAVYDGSMAEWVREGKPLRTGSTP